MYTFEEEAYNYANNIEKSDSYEVDNRGINNINTHNEIERLYDIFRDEYNECK